MTKFGLRLRIENGLATKTRIYNCIKANVALKCLKLISAFTITYVHSYNQSISKHSIICAKSRLKLKPQVHVLDPNPGLPSAR